MGDDGNSGFDGGSYGGGLGDVGGLGGGGGLSTGDIGDVSGYGDANFGGESGLDVGFGSGFGNYGSLSGLNDFGLSNPDGFGAPDMGGSFGTSDFSGMSEPGFLDQLGRFLQNPIGKIGMSLAARANPNLGFVNSLIGTATKGNQIGNATTRGPGMGHFGGIAGAALGSAFAGPIGGMLGGYAGNALGNAAGQGSANYSGPSGATPGDGGMGLGTGMGLGLASLYQNYKNNKESGGQLSSLQNMYGQNSPYSQALRQQLERRDAASGRRSQYGPREVELQAQLAQMASRNAPAVNQLLQMRNQQRGQNLGQLAGIYQQMGGMRGIQGGLQGLYSDVGGMFTGMDQYDNTGYGIDNTFDTGSFNDVMPDTWGG